MNISNRHNEAIEFLASIANGRTSLRKVAEQRRVSISYLEHLAAVLLKAGIVRSTRGPGGGYELTRPLSEIELVDLLKAVGLTDESQKTVLLKTILRNLSGITVAQALSTDNA
ncbi:Rrf2 family transcriptional regulator [Salmonella enterica]|nr:Rrf2 family transcriptional regulator [Salmonella enterica]